MRQPTREEINEIVELWHLSKVYASGRHDRMLKTVDWYLTEHPGTKSLWVYKVLERQLAGLYVRNRPRSARPGYQNIRRPYLRRMGLSEETIDRVIARQMNGATLADAIYAEQKYGTMSHPRGRAGRASRKQRPQRNPREVMIYPRIGAITACKAGMPHNCDAECKAAGHWYIHEFKKGSGIFGKVDGSINVRRKRR